MKKFSTRQLSVSAAVLASSVVGLALTVAAPPFEETPAKNP